MRSASGQYIQLALQQLRREMKKHNHKEYTSPLWNHCQQLLETKTTRQVIANRKSNIDQILRQDQMHHRKQIPEL